MAQPDFRTARWRKSSTSGDGGCVEVALSDGWIGLRDTKAQGSGPILTFTLHEWNSFLTGADNGEFAPERLAE